MSVEQRFPHGIRWREPVKVEVPGQGSWLACRICIAEKGLKAEELPERGFATREEFDAHMTQEHA